MLPTQKQPSGPTLPSLKRFVGGSLTGWGRLVISRESGSKRTTGGRSGTTRRPDRQKPKLPTTSGKSHVRREPSSTDRALIFFPGMSQNSRRRVDGSQTGDSATPQRESQTSSNCAIAPPCVFEKCQTEAARRLAGTVPLARPGACVPPGSCNPLVSKE